PMPESREAAGALPPDFVFDILETPLQDFGGDVIYERDDRGNPTPARRFSPTFWSHRFQTHRLLEEVNLREIETDTTQNLSLQRTPKPPRRTMQHEWVRFRNLFKRAFLSKLRNKSNFVTTLLEAPALGAVIGMVLRYSEEGDYTFQNAFHIPTYFFMALVVALFLGLTNSAEEIIRDRSILNRERHHGLRVTGYILSKYLSLAFFALIQCVIFLLIADSILGIRGMFFQNLLWMFCTALVGIAAGLFVSSVVSSPKTAVNLVPMILIPNIILGGALIKYEEMNKNINILNSLRMWFAQAEAADPQASHLKVPAICHLMPLRWSYESLIIAHAEQTLPGKLDNYIDREIEEFTAIPITQKLTDSQSQRLGQLKDARVTLATLEAESPSEVGAALRDIKKQLQRVEFDPENYQRDFPKGAKLYTPDELFSNEKIQDLFMKAEIERLDTRRAENPPNVFFGKQRNFRFPLNSNKPWISFQVDTLRLNFFAMSMFVIIAFILLRFTLKRQLRKV
ncbi:MAG: ABC transporter permease, partial [Verrucomicrobiota bacterium]